MNSTALMRIEKKRDTCCKKRNAKERKAEHSEIIALIQKERRKERKKKRKGTKVVSRWSMETGRTMEKGEEQRAEEYKERREEKREREGEGDGTMHASAQFAPSFQIMI